MALSWLGFWLWAKPLLFPTTPTWILPSASVAVPDETSAPSRVNEKFVPKTATPEVTYEPFKEIEPELPGVVVSIMPSGSEEVPTVIAPSGSTFAEILVIVLKFVVPLCVAPAETDIVSVLVDPFSNVPFTVKIVFCVPAFCILTLSDEFGDCEVNIASWSLTVPIITFPLGLRLAFISVTVLKNFDPELPELHLKLLFLRLKLQM